MKTWKSVLVPYNTSIIDAIKIIDKSAMQIGLVVDANRKLLGVITDGNLEK